MKFRRVLLPLLLALTFAGPAQAWTSAVPYLDENPFTQIRFPRGFVPVTTNNSRITINVGGGPYLNLAKGMGWFVSPTNCASPPCTDSNGYPNQAPSSVVVSNTNLLAGYYGTYTWSWSGSGAMQDNTGNPAIFTSISPQGAVFEMGNVSSGDHAPSIYGIICATGATCGGQGSNTTVANPSIVYQYGWNIQSITNNGTLIHVVTKTNYVTSKCWGNTGPDQNGNVGPLVNISGANSNTGANGIWVMTNCGASSFDLTGSTFTNGQASAGGVAIFAGGNLSYRMLPQGTWTSFNNLVIARTADLTAIAAGHYWDATYVSQLQTLMNPNGTCAANHDCGWIRFMDFNGTQTNWETDFSQRIPTTAISYGTHIWYPAGYWVGSITNTSDALTVADPSTSVWSGSAYRDGAVVQGYISATNTTYTPTLNVGGHGAKPVIAKALSIPPMVMFLTGVPATPGTDVLTFTFSAGGASWFNGGSSCTANYTTQASDTSITTLSGHLATYFGGGTVGANTPITCLTSSSVLLGNPINSIGPVLYPPTAQAGRFAVSYSSVQDPSLVKPGTIAPSSFSSGSSNLVTFTYNYLLDAWIYWSGEFVFSPPMEVAIDLANQVGSNVYWNFTQNSSGYVQSVAQTFGNPSTGLTSGLRFGFEVGNEVWNCFGPDPCPIYLVFGTAFNINGSSNNAQYSYTSLRTIQYCSVAKSAWTGQGRSANDFYVFIMAQAAGNGVGSSFDTNQVASASIGTANTWIANYGALGGGTVSTNYAAAGNRAVDCSTNVGIGLAPYWGSPWWGPVGTSIVGTLANNAPWLQAQLDYANGNPTLAYSEITNTFNGTTARTDGLGAGGSQWFNAGSSSQNLTTMYTNMEAIAAEYDTYRAGAGLKKIARFDYEGGPQWSFSNNSVNGTNSATDATSIQVLSARITSLGWNVGPYILSGQPAISSGTYNNSTGLVTLTLASGLAYSSGSTFTGTSTGNNQVTVSSGLTGSITIGQTVAGLTPTSTITGQLSGTPGGIGVYTMNQNASGTPTGTGDSITVSSLTGTGAFASLDGSFVTTAGTSGSTITYLATAGLGASTITGGTVYDTTASSIEVTNQTLNFSQAWKNSSSYANVIYTSLYQNLVSISGANREVHGAQYGYSANIWGLYPGDLHFNNPYQNFNAIQTQNAGN